MNKLIMFPLAFLFLMMIFSVIYTGETYIQYSENYSEHEGLYLNGTPTGNVTIPNTGTFEIDIWKVAGAISILILAISIGIASGIRVNVLGSSVELSEQSQRYIFISALFLGIWASVSYISSEFLLGNLITTVFWIGLTIMYAVGVGIQAAGGGGPSL